jgi:ElaB/YqjD/DUF883 family membrane-anchored ribosome-binding protein
MVFWSREESRPSGYLRDLDDLQDQLDNLRSSLTDLTASFGKAANRQWDRARHAATTTAEEAEELMKDNLAASLVLALGLGIVVGYLIRRSSE